MEQHILNFCHIANLYTSNLFIVVLSYRYTSENSIFKESQNTSKQNINKRPYVILKKKNIPGYGIFCVFCRENRCICLLYLYVYFLPRHMSADKSAVQNRIPTTVDIQHYDKECNISFRTIPSHSLWVKTKRTHPVLPFGAVKLGICVSRLSVGAMQCLQCRQTGGMICTWYKLQLAADSRLCLYDTNAMLYWVSSADSDWKLAACGGGQSGNFRRQSDREGRPSPGRRQYREASKNQSDSSGSLPDFRLCRSMTWRCCFSPPVARSRPLRIAIQCFTTNWTT